MSEKFCLKWNDFQNNVSQSFGVLRSEKEFFDVTLVSEDETQFEAHKLVLAACSPFFKKILIKNKSSHPLLYLNGLHSSILKSVLDYIYLGEASVEQDSLERFLTASQKLRLKGLLLVPDEEVVPAPNPVVVDQNSMQVVQNIHIPDNSTQNIVQLPKRDSIIAPANDQIFSKKPQTAKYYKIEQPGATELDERISTMISKDEFSKKYKCHVCGKTLCDRTSAIFHSETHFPDLVYKCDKCNKTAKSRNGLRQHKSTFHKDSIPAPRIFVSPIKKENILDDESQPSIQNQNYLIPTTNAELEELYKNDL